MRHLSKEELSGKIEGFSEAFFMKTSKELNFKVLQAYLEQNLEKIELRLIDEAFSNLSHENIRTLLQITKEKRKNGTANR